VVSAEGDYTLQASVQDKAGNNSSKIITFIIDKTLPQVTINPLTSPTNVSVQTITGTYLEANIGTIKLNNIIATLDDTTKTYSAQITLSEGENQITVTASDLKPV